MLIEKTLRSLVIIGLCGGMIACWTSGSKASRNSDTAGAATQNPIESPTPEPKNSVSKPQSNNQNSEQSNKKMTEKNAFRANLPPGFSEPDDDAGRLLLREYGAVFVCRGGVTPPTRVVFKDENEVTAFQNSLKSEKISLGGFTLELQSAAVAALKLAVNEAEKSGLRISPRGADSARRSYSQTVTLWASRVNPGLRYWSEKGRISKEEAERIRTLSPYEQVLEILALEKKEIFFAKDFSKSIIYSVAPPGTSQHLSMLALDVAEHDNARVRGILAKYGWFQTVVSDLPHFTYLGVSESELPSLGLKKVENGGRVFWVPDI